MHLFFDARHLSLPFTGIGRYVKNLLTAILKNPYYQELSILALPKEENDLQQLIKLRNPNQLTNLIIKEIPLKGSAHHFTTSKIVNYSNCSYYLYPHFDVPYFVKKPVITVIHDIMPIILKDYFTNYALLKQTYFKYFIKRSLNKRYQVLTVSETTKNDILRIIANKNPEVASILHPLTSAATLPLLKPDANLARPSLPYILYVGERRPHKNLASMIAIYSRLVSMGLYSGEFIIIGSKTSYTSETSMLIKNTLGVKELGFVTDTELAGYYKYCDALFFLTKYEGFGLPIVEAGQYGKKIIASNIGAAKEVAPDWSLILDPNDSIESLTTSIGKYFTEVLPSEAQIIDYQKKYSWDKLASSLLNLINNKFNN